MKSEYEWTDPFKRNPLYSISNSQQLLLDDSIIVWKQRDRIISAGLGMIRKDKRMSLLSHREGVNLQITNLHIDDAGNYICEVEHEGEPIVQTNQLQVLGKISLRKRSHDNYLSFSASKNCNFSPWAESYCKKGFKVLYFHDR